MELDLLSLDSVVRFAEEWNSRSRPLHVLINNAGIFSIGGWFLWISVHDHPTIFKNVLSFSHWRCLPNLITRFNLLWRRKVHYPWISIRRFCYLYEVDQSFLSLVPIQSSKKHGMPSCMAVWKPKSHQCRSHMHGPESRLPAFKFFVVLFLVF